jgi:hypothetical protein
VYVQHPIDSLESDVLNRRLFAYACVVHQNIDPSQRPLRVGVQASRRRHLAEVASPGERAPSSRPHSSLDFWRSIVIIVMAKGDICALCCEGPGDRCADSSTAASDEGRAVIELACSGHRFASILVSEFDFHAEVRRPDTGLVSGPNVFARAGAERPVIEAACVRVSFVVRPSLNEECGDQSALAHSVSALSRPPGLRSAPHRNDHGRPGSTRTYGPRSRAPRGKPRWG